MSLLRVRRAVRPAVALLGVLAAVAACSPTPTGSAVPSIYPVCIGAPSCVVEQGATIQTAAISDDGRIMATVRTKSTGIRTTPSGDYPSFQSTIDLVGIQDRWYRRVAVLDPTHVIPFDIVMTPNAELLAFNSRVVPGEAADPAAGLRLYRRSTATLTTIAAEGEWTPVGISDDGSVLVAQRNPGEVWSFDLVAGTSRQLASHVSSVSMSGDGRYLFWNAAGSAIRHDQTDDSEITLPGSFQDTTTSAGDGSRVADANRFDSGATPRFRFLDVGDAAFTPLLTSPANGPIRLSRDGTHLIGGPNTGSPIASPTVVDWNLGTGTSSVIAPLSQPVAVSPNGNHVLYAPSGSTSLVRWNR